jgi:hypothetical protein
MPLPDPRYGVLSRAVSEYFGQPLYDTVNYAAAGQVTITFFAIPRGQAAVLATPAGGAPAAGTIKTYRDTNMDTANFVPDKRWVFNGMSWKIRRQGNLVTDQADRELIQNNGWFDFQIGDKHVLYIPALDVPIFNPIINTTWGGTNITSIGGYFGIYQFADPMVIDPGNRISVTLNYPALVVIITSTDIQLTLHGSMQRAT